MHSEEMTSVLFSCDECEVDLTEEDKRDLGLNNVKTDGLKRLKGVVMTGQRPEFLGFFRHFEDSRRKYLQRDGLGESSAWCQPRPIRTQSRNCVH